MLLIPCLVPLHQGSTQQVHTTDNSGLKERRYCDPTQHSHPHTIHTTRQPKKHAETKQHSLPKKIKSNETFNKSMNVQFTNDDTDVHLVGFGGDLTCRQSPPPTANKKKKTTVGRSSTGEESSKNTIAQQTNKQIPTNQVIRGRYLDATPRLAPRRKHWPRNVRCTTRFWKL